MRVHAGQQQPQAQPRNPKDPVTVYMRGVGALHWPIGHLANQMAVDLFVAAYANGQRSEDTYVAHWGP